MLWTFPKNRCRRFRFSTSQVASTKLSHGLFGREEPKGGKRSGVIPYGDPETPTRLSRVWWYFVDLDRENQNARRTAVSNARHKTHDQHHCCICPPQPNWGRPTADRNLDRASGRSSALVNRQPKRRLRSDTRNLARASLVALSSIEGLFFDRSAL